MKTKAEKMGVPDSANRLFELIKKVIKEKQR
jgi:hypothetical protein